MQAVIGKRQALGPSMQALHSLTIFLGYDGAVFHVVVILLRPCACGCLARGVMLREGSIRSFPVNTLSLSSILQVYTSDA
jgi:hypothetical protein